MKTLVSNEKQEKVNRFRFDIDKNLSLYSELLIRIIICSNTDNKNKDIVFNKTYYGYRLDSEKFLSKSCRMVIQPNQANL